MSWFRRRALACREAVALISDYVDRRLPHAKPGASSATWGAARTATSTSTRYASPSRRLGGDSPKTCARRPGRSWSRSTDVDAGNEGC